MAEKEDYGCDELFGPLGEDPKPKEGRSLGDKGDGDPYPGYPIKFPMGADDSINRSIRGKGENEKTHAEKHMTEDEK